jgi:hypothetical protein
VALTWLTSHNLADRHGREALRRHVKDFMNLALHGEEWQRFRSIQLLRDEELGVRDSLLDGLLRQARVEADPERKYRTAQMAGYTANSMGESETLALVLQEQDPAVREALLDSYHLGPEEAYSSQARARIGEVLAQGNLPDERQMQLLKDLVEEWAYEEEEARRLRPELAAYLRGLYPASPAVRKYAESLALTIEAFEDPRNWDQRR